MAYSSDGGITWTKYENNPILKRSDDPLSDNEFRDPNVFFCEKFGKFLMVVAGGPLRIYSSDDLINWKFESGYDNSHPSYRPAGVGAIYSECPDLFPLALEGEPDTVKWIYTGAGEWYMTGELEQIDGRISFIPDSPERYPLKFGYDAYAGITFKNAPDDRVVMVSWMMNWGYAGSMPTDPWNGTFTLCYDLTLKRTDKGLRVFADAAKEYTSLRGDALADLKNIVIDENKTDPLSQVRSDCFELDAHILPDKGVSEVGFELYAGNSYALTVRYEPKTSRLTVDRSNVSDVKPGAYGSLGIADTVIGKNKDGSVDLRIFADRGSVEVIANGGEIYGAFLVFPDSASMGMRTYSTGGNTSADIAIYQLSSVYRESESGDIEGVYLDIADNTLIPLGQQVTINSRVLCGGADQNVSFELTDPDGVIEKVSQTSRSITLKAVGSGRFILTAKTSDQKQSRSVNLTAGEGTFRTNLSGFRTSGNGKWSLTAHGYNGSTSGDGFAVSSEVFEGDFRLSLDVTFNSGVAFGIVFCSESEPARGSYMVNFDLGNSEQGNKFRWTEFPYQGSSSDNAQKAFGKSVTPEAGKTHHIDLYFINGRLTYIFNGSVIFEGAADKNKSAAFSRGHIGIMGYSSDFTVNDLYVYTGNELEGILLSDGELSPAFDPSEKSYTASVPFSKDHITLTALLGGGVSASLNEKPLAGGAPSDPVALEVGSNMLTLKVVFAGNETIYTINVTREGESGGAAPDAENQGVQTPDAKKNSVLLPVLIAVIAAAAAAVTAIFLARRRAGSKKPDRTV